MDNRLLTDLHVLLLINVDINEYLNDNLCCRITTYDENFTCDPRSILYLCGDIEQFDFNKYNNEIYIVGNGSFNNSTNHKIISYNQLPHNYHNVGVLMRNFFEPGNFERVQNAHEFQSLTESNKPTPAYRSGIYITPVEDTERGREFNLLRCSSNFTGPTDDCSVVDYEIINKVNEFIGKFYSCPSLLNHVLAQIYHNDNNKKAKIKQHSDKTKDMDENALLAFCSFYDDDDLRPMQVTHMKFKLKDDVEGNYEKQFTVPFTPNSLFVISLEMNRLYTHEIIPGKMQISQLPTRMGYVIRGSNTRAVWRDGKVFINNETELVEPYDEGVKRLKDLYYEENMTSNKVIYDGFDFSLNKGDYMKPKRNSDEN